MISGKLGYNRQEVSFAPVFQKNDGDPDAACSHVAFVRQAQIDLATAQNDAAKAQKNPGLSDEEKQQKADVLTTAQDRVNWLNKEGASYHRIPVYVPSTFASASDSIGSTDAQNAPSGPLTVAQVFATGKAAELVAQGPGNSAITAVARSISPPSQSTTVAGPVFVVTVTGVAQAAASTGAAAASATPATAENKIEVSLDPNLPGDGSFTPKATKIAYTSKSTDKASDIAAGLAKAVNADATASAIGLQATAKAATIALSIPKNLSGFFPANFNWQPSPASGAVTMTLQKSP